MENPKSAIKKTTLGVCMIVRDEETVLERCLSCLSSFADEIVVVDTGSSDRTKDIALRFTDRVFDYKWTDDFAAARNYSCGKSSCDYIMWLDADDVIGEDDQYRIRKWKENAGGDLILAGYDRPENGGIFLYPRIVKADAHFFWEGIVHEHLTQQNTSDRPTKTDVRTADFVIKHRNPGEPDYTRNIKLMEKIPKEKLLDSFWLCAQCFLDCVLAGETQRADYYLLLAEKSTTPFENRLSDYALINAVLKYHKKYDAMIRWNAIYLNNKEASEGGPEIDRDSLCHT